MHSDAMLGERAAARSRTNKRQLIEISALATFPGHWLLKGRTDGESGEWYVIRSPKGSYRMAVVAAETESKPARVEMGDRISDSRLIAELEAAFLKLWKTIA